MLIQPLNRIRRHICSHRRPSTSAYGLEKQHLHIHRRQECNTMKYWHALYEYWTCYYCYCNTIFQLQFQVHTYIKHYVHCTSCCKPIGAPEQMVLGVATWKLVMHIVGEHSPLEKSGKHVELCWIPSHIGITGNEKADAAAKAALCQQITFSKLPATDLYPSVSQYCSSEWQVS